MSSFSGGITVIAGFTKPSSSQTVINTSQSLTLTAETTIRSTTATTTWYINQITLDGATGAIGNIILKDNTTEIFRVSGTQIVPPSAPFQPTVINFPVPLKVLTSLKVSASGAAGSVNFTTQGFEQA